MNRAAFFVARILSMRPPKEELDKNNLRVELDTKTESVSYKVRAAQLQKIPIILIVGEKEEIAKSVSVRKQGEGELGTFSIEEFANLINKEIEAKL